MWMALIMIGGWFVGCFSLIAYRLKSDDLELMEREVYEELQKKKEVERFLQKSKREDRLIESRGNVTDNIIDKVNSSHSDRDNDDSFDRELKRNRPDRNGL